MSALIKIVALCVVVAGAAGLIVWAYGSVALAPSQRAVPAAPESLGAERVVLSESDAPDLVGWLIPERGAPCGVVAILHGRGSSRDRMLARAELFAEAGMASAVFDFRGHGESGGDVTGFGYHEADDAVRIASAARAFRPDAPLAIVGVSLGAAAAAEAADRLEAQAYVLEIMFSTLSETVARRMPAPVFQDAQAAVALSQLGPRLGYSASALRPIDRVARIDAPMLFLAGDQDPWATPQQNRDLAAAAGDNGRLVWFEDAAHIDLLDHAPRLYAEETVQFLRAALCPDA